MADTKFNIPDSLIEELKAKRVVPFIGAGISRSIEKKDKNPSKSFDPLFPSWKEFLVSAAMKLRGEKNFAKAKDVIKLIHLSEPDYLKSAEVAETALKTVGWNKLLNDNFKRQESEADPNSLNLSRLIWQLGSNLIYTTNIDDVLEWKSVNNEKIERLDTQTDEFAELHQQENISTPTVVYLHGHIGNKANIVFTQTQYEKFYDAHGNEAKLQTLRSFLTRRSFLFLGFSLDDPYFLRQLDYIHKIYNGAASSFYVLLPEWEEGNKNIPEYVNVFTFSNFGKPLLDKVQALSEIAKSGDKNVSDKTGNNNSKTSPVNSEPAKKPFFNVPYNSKGAEFVGRVGKIDEIWESLTKSGCASIGQAVSVKGFGGLGKTQLAVEYAHANRDKYQNGVFWLVADESIDNQLLQIADKLGWINQYDKTVNQLDVAKAKFLALSDCLILFDNVETHAAIKDYLPEMNQRTHILITSREKLPAFKQIDLDLLKRDESRELLLKISNRQAQSDDEKQHLEAILDTLDGIPLAVELVGGYLSEHENVSFAKYQQFLNETPLDKIEKEFPEGSFTGHDRSIIQTLRISEKTIKEKPLMVEILKVLAWSGSSSMGVSLLKHLVESNDDFEFETALGDADKLRLLKKDEDAERYAIHRLLAKVIRHENPLENQAEWREKTVNNLENWFNERNNEFQYLAEFESEIEHLNEWQKHIINSLPENFIRLTALESYPLWQRGNYQKTLQLLENAFNFYKIKSIINNELLAHLQNDLGVTYGALGNHSKALEYLEKALELQKELFGEQHPNTATSYNNVGGNYKDLGDYPKALEYQEKALELRKELFGEQHPDTATSYNNVGGTYGELGNHSKALEYQEKSLDIYRELLGEAHPKAIVIVKNVISTYLKLGSKEKAGRKAAEFFNYFPQNHPDWQSLEELSRPYRKKKNRRKK